MKARSLVIFASLGMSGAALAANSLALPFSTPVSPSVSASARSYVEWDGHAWKVGGGIEAGGLHAISDLDSANSWVVVHYDDYNHILSNEDFCASRPEDTVCTSTTVIVNDSGSTQPAGNQFVVVNGKAYPVCSSPDKDPDGDGWGWEFDKSCKVQFPYCSSSASDNNGDGWGWENNQSCLVR